jgi:hypothetical protein
MWKRSKTLVLPDHLIQEITRRNFLRNGVSMVGYASAASLLSPSGLLLGQTASYPPQRRLVWISMTGGWDILETTDAKPASTSDIDVTYDWGLANTLAGSESSERIGRWLPKLAKRGSELVVVRGLSMGTNSHTAGQVYMDTGVLSNSGDVNAASIPAIVASESQATIPIVQLNGGAEPLTDRGLFNPVSVVRAQNLDLYRSMYPATRKELDQKLLMLDYLRNSATRMKAVTGTNDRLTDLESAEAKVRVQFESDVGSKLELTGADLTAFNDGAPANLDESARDAFALTLKLLKNDLVTCVNLGFNGFDTHANQERRLEPVVTSFDHLIAVLIDELKAADALDNTLIVIYSDFGRTPKVNQTDGRDHWPVGGAMMIGGGIAGARFVGGTNDSLQSEFVDATSGLVTSANSGIQLNPTHLAGSVLELVLGSTYMQYRSYLQSIPALTRLRS